RKVRTQTPPRPSTLRSGVPRPLEAICLRALERDPKRRYASAADLAAEVQKWLADEPVQSYREPITGRLKRCARHHKPIVASGAVLLVTVVSAVVVGMIVLGEERAQMAELRIQAARVHAAADARGRAELETRAYYQRIALAEREVSAGNTSRAIQYLAACPA